jgi:hypothetical protein
MTSRRLLSHSIRRSVRDASGSAGSSAPATVGTDPATVTGCTLVLREDTGLTLSGSDVTAWADQVGANNYAQGTGGLQPVVGAGNKVVFDGSDDFLQSTTFIGDHLSSTSYAAYYVFTLDSAAPAGAQAYTDAMLHGETVDCAWGVMLYSSGGQDYCWVEHVEDGTNIERKTTPIAISTGTLYCVRVRYNGSTVRCRINGSEQSVAATALYDNGFAARYMRFGEGYVNKNVAVTVRYVAAFNVEPGVSDLSGIDDWISDQFAGVTL